MKVMPSVPCTVDVKNNAHNRIFQYGSFFSEGIDNRGTLMKATLILPFQPVTMAT